MADVFISYSSEDAKLVRELVKIMENQGWSVFWDRDLVVGGDFEKQLEKELALATCVLVVWSKNSTESSWVRAEAHEALKRGCLVPARIDDTSLPFVFRTTETADLDGWPMESRSVEMRKLIMAVKLSIEGSANRESSRNELKIRDDPTLSTRVAHRVLDALSGQEDNGTSLALETLIADAAMKRLFGASAMDSAQLLLEQLMDVFESSAGILLLGDEEYLRASQADRDDLVSIAKFATESSFRAPDGDGAGYCCLVGGQGRGALAFLVEQPREMPEPKLGRLESVLGAITSD
jgi:hypothetical protein